MSTRGVTRNKERKYMNANTCPLTINRKTKTPPIMNKCNGQTMNERDRMSKQVQRNVDLVASKKHRRKSPKQMK